MSRPRDEMLHANAAYARQKPAGMICARDDDGDWHGCDEGAGPAARIAQPLTHASIFQSMTQTALFNKPQRNHFAVLLAMMEDSLAEMERLAERDLEPARELTRWADDLPPGIVEPLRSRLTLLRQKIRVLGKRLGIEPRDASRKRAIRAIVTAELLRIEDSYAAGLRGYGAVNPAAASIVDPAMDELHAEFTAIARLLAGG